MENPGFKRAIRSFVLRQGHLSASQQRAIDEGMPRWGIEYRPEQLDLAQAFGRDAPKILEIGFGMGGATAEIAANMPHNDYLGVEVHSPGVGNLFKLIEEKQLTNLRLLRHDAVEVLDNMLADGSLDGVHIFFPDPWHKKRHNKRRLIQAPLVEKLVKKLKPGGYLHAATDWEDYAIQILEVFNGNADLQNTAEAYAPRPDYRPLTKFEARGIRLGHGVWDIIFTRK
ncbi:tRNA (guanosine(46)-N7)-methyltransferase TrmB [Vogesella sp. XCS3]|jgi:tRNA (guanine-N7-)-methyltransferase|uniref:tRNA (guanosine(46)-N7)-methyltransferase TrmB n=1 Tax=unclassified Vogesella TaxID=2684990 RepID=UPI0003799DD5|nr:tRNA (guanosine(46)-N7)-methyltransferase TrmB [Vogesella sp. XCS3]UDM16922.1 tRNA (guanosine(46)-N7)-methyltransferase TrmB [Vogesella sp. XCS3]